MSKNATSQSRPRRRREPAVSQTSRYLLVVRGPDGRPRCEGVRDAGTYRRRLAAIGDSADDAFSIEEIAGLLDS